jgi:opacity protein-like surface antigen
MMRSASNLSYARWFTALAVSFVAASASAQDASAQTAAPAPAPTPVLAPAPPPRPVYTAPAEGTDHDLWVGHIGVGWFGTRDIPVGAPAASGGTIATPVVGVRYWLNPGLGIDIGLGLGHQSGSTTTANGSTSLSTDKASNTSFVLHGGLPLALANTRHFSFQLTPELDVGFGTGTTGGAGGDIDRTGFLLQAGARAGAEVYFGFIGIPALALDASVGLFLRSTSSKSSQGANSAKDSDFTIATSSINQPWDIFRSNVAARYYF